MADLVMPALLVLLVVFLVQDALWPARRNPQVKGWRVKGVLFTLLALALNVAIPALAAPVLGARSLVDGAGLGIWGGVLVGIVVSELAAYWTHRLFHEVDPLWRWFHQMHHAAERFDTYGAFFFHPNEILFQIGLSLAVSGPVLGLAPEAAGLVGATMFFLAYFQHANVRTPRWLGYLVQRPENHGVHHARGVHTGNFGNFSFCDILFGTFSNPAEAPARAGFYEGGTARMKDLLLGKDISLGGLGRDAPGTSRGTAAI
jgi:sterol desaturase/sphingolipid hydroxylase (fatty acid hydroxylase superfamily)